MKKILNIILTNKDIYEMFKIDFTYHSSQIEGSKITKQENTRLIQTPFDKKLISLELKTYQHDEVYENRNLGLVFDKMISTLFEPLTKQMICEWFKLLKQETYWSNNHLHAIGKYRKENVEVGDSENFALSFQYIEEHMINFINDFNYKRKITIDDVCEFHCRFERIHPFLDGNGRIGRLIMLKQCLMNNVTPFLIDNDTRSEYINSLKLYHQTNFSSFLVEYCKKLQTQFLIKYESRFNVEQNDRQLQIINFIKQHGFIKRTDVEKIFNISPTSAKFLIKKLIIKKVLQSKNDGKLTIYVLNKL